jgi:hypothetical protein
MPLVTTMLEIFGEAYEEGGQVKHRAFHSYTMKQAIQEGQGICRSEPCGSRRGT